MASSKSKIFLLEDDFILGPSIQMTLNSENFETFLCVTLKNAHEEIKRNVYDLFLLDFNLPDGEALGFCRILRQQQKTEPIIFVTAELSEDVVVNALEAGANDYLKKPFGNRELVARIKRHLSLNKKDTTEKFKNIALNSNNLTLSCGQNSVVLSKREFEIMKLLLRTEDALLSKERIIASGNLDVQLNTIDSHISHLRKKLKAIAADNYKIVSVYGAGYRLTLNHEED